jgi:glycosyltransferase involved in cell wall biosynthesis
VGARRGLGQPPRTLLVRVRIVAPLAGVPGEPPSGGYRYDEALAHALRAQGHDARVVEAPEPGAVHLFDGLGAPRWASRLGAVPGVKVALVHQPAGALDAAPEAHAAEASLLAGCAAVHFVSARAERDARARHGSLPPAWVAAPGIDHFTPAPPRRERRLAAIGHLVPGKGALEALEVVAGLSGDWHLDWLGAVDVDAAYAARVLERRRALGLDGRVTFHGRVALAAVAQVLARASACVATSRYESWGLGLAEALRAGVPVVGPTPAGVLEFLGGVGARGGALRAWLSRCLDGDPAGEALRGEARAAGALLPTWAECAATTARHLEALCGG